jgi:hypothetical protein
MAERIYTATLKYGVLQNLPEQGEPERVIYVSSAIMKDCKAQGIDIHKFYWENYNARVEVSKPIPYG